MRLRKSIGSTIKLVWCTFIFFVCCNLAWAQESDPDLYLDGKKLANEVGRKLQEKESDSRALDVKPVKNMMDHLAAGFSFTSKQDVDRQALMQWVMSKPLHSIKPDELIVQAIQIRGGNIQGGLMLAYDHLVDGWYRSDLRNTYEHTLRLADITGELRSFDGNSKIYGKRSVPIVKRLLNAPIFSSGAAKQTIRGDNFSAWYHFMGVALSTYMSKRSMSPLPANLVNKGFVFASEYVFSGVFIDGQKRLKIDLAAPDFATELVRVAQNPDSLGPKTPYLYSDPNSYGPKWHLKEGQLPGDYGTTEKHRNRPTMMESIYEIREKNPKVPGQKKSLESFLASTLPNLNHIKVRNPNAIAANQVYDRVPNVLARAALTRLATDRSADATDFLQRTLEKYWANESVAELIVRELIKRKDVDKLVLSQRVFSKTKSSIVKMAVADAVNAVSSREASKILSLVNQNSDFLVRRAFAEAASGRSDLSKDQSEYFEKQLDTVRRQQVELGSEYVSTALAAALGKAIGGAAVLGGCVHYLLSMM